MTKTILLAAAAFTLAGGAHAASWLYTSGDARTGMSFADYDFSIDRMAGYSELGAKVRDQAVEPLQSGEPAPSQVSVPSPVAQAAQDAIAVLQSLQSSVQNQRQSGSGSSQSGSTGQSNQSPSPQGDQGQGSQGEQVQGAQGNQGQGSQGSQGGQGQGGGGGVQAGIPEISTWAMLVAGLGMIGVALRRRSTTTLKA